MNHAARRRALTARVGAPILLVNNGRRARNLAMNLLPFRADSTFLYFTGCPEPGAAALLDGESCTLFLTAPEAGDELWHGHVDTLEDRRVRYGGDDVRGLDELISACDDYLQRDQTILALAVPDSEQTALASRATGTALSYASNPGSDALVDAIIAQRRRRDADELAEMRLAAAVSERAHVAAMRATRVGGTEREIAALFDAVLAANGAANAYHSIVTVRGEILHNPDYNNDLSADDLLLLDGGAEVASGYASDVTRTWPVRGRFDARQRDVYEIVLAAQTAGIAMVTAGTRYANIHWHATRILAEGLKGLGLLRGDVDGLVESGAAGLFFPHGLGHLIGLDVHDLENFGDRPAYAPGRSRPTQFGARFLRMDLDLEPGIVVTIEPGIYFVPAILHDGEMRAQFADHVDFDAAESWLSFGGIRIEDDVLCTDAAPEVLTERIPKTVEALESMVGSGPSARERFSA